jgi:hypothetical protein
MAPIKKSLVSGFVENFTKNSQAPARHARKNREQAASLRSGRQTSVFVPA